MALILAILYFGLIELLMIESAQQLDEARRFRARIVALTLAENGAELAAAGMCDPKKMKADAKSGIADGKMTGKLEKQQLEKMQTFDIQATGEATGVAKTHAEVRILGRIEGSTIHIDYALHSQ